MNYLPDYKGYSADIEIDFEDHILHGRIDGIRDLVTFESETVEGIVREFHSAVEAYLELCARHGKVPDMPMQLPVAAYA